MLRLATIAKALRAEGHVDIADKIERGMESIRIAQQTATPPPAAVPGQVVNPSDPTVAQPAPAPQQTSTNQYTVDSPALQQAYTEVDRWSKEVQNFQQQLKRAELQVTQYKRAMEPKLKEYEEARVSTKNIMTLWKQFLKSPTMRKAQTAYVRQQQAQGRQEAPIVLIREFVSSGMVASLWERWRGLRASVGDSPFSGTPNNLFKPR